MLSWISSIKSPMLGIYFSHDPSQLREELKPFLPLHRLSQSTLMGGSIILFPLLKLSTWPLFINTLIPEKHSDCRKSKQFRRHYIHIKHLVVTPMFEGIKCHSKISEKQNTLRRKEAFCKLAAGKLKL